jgi:hypothetical protein
MNYSDLVSVLPHLVFVHVSGEEVSVSLVYALGLWTDQTPPIRASKKNTAGKRKQNRVDSREGELGKTGARPGPTGERPNMTKGNAVIGTTLNQTRLGGMKP